MKWPEILTWIDGVSYTSDWMMALCGNSKYSLITAVVRFIVCMYL